MKSTAGPVVSRIKDSQNQYSGFSKSIPTDPGETLAIAFRPSWREHPELRATVGAKSRIRRLGHCPV